MCEKIFERKLITKVKKLGGLAVKFWSVTNNGLPDRIVLMPNGKLWFVELKSPGKKTTFIQNMIIEKLEALGFDVWVVSTQTSLNTFLKHIQK